MLSAYADWQFRKRILKTLPTVSCSPNAKVTGWLNFSEYWSFRNGIPESEKIFILDILNQTQSKKVQEKRVVFDVGANIGLFSVMLADLENIDVHAFEPIPATFERLKNNITLNHFDSKIHLNLIAVGSEKGEVEFDVFADSPAINRLSNRSQIAPQSTKVICQKVPVIALDDYCKNQNIEQIDFLKIDVEGMETQVLQGAKELLKAQKVSSILLEVCPNNLRITCNSVEVLYSTILELGYSVYRLSEDGKPDKVLTISDLEKVRLENVVLFPDS